MNSILLRINKARQELKDVYNRLEKGKHELMVLYSAVILEAESLWN